MRSSAAISLTLAAAAAACTPQPPPARPDAGAPDGGLAFLPEAHTEVVLSLHPDGGRAGTTAPSAPPSRAALPVLVAEAVLADGSALPLSRDGVTVVDPSVRFRVEVGARIPEARLSLLDAQDAMVAADGAVEVTGTTRFTLAPAAPLRPASAYTLRLDGAEGRLLRSEDGGAWEPPSLALRVSGTPAAPARKAKRRTRR